MTNIENSNFIRSFTTNENVKEINYLSSNSVKVLYLDGTYHTYVLDEKERIIYCNLNGEIVQKNEYDDNNNIVKTLECTEYGFTETTYESDQMINPILKIQNGEKIQFPYTTHYFV